jgi:protein subunit release factor A
MSEREKEEELEISDNKQRREQKMRRMESSQTKIVDMHAYVHHTVTYFTDVTTADESNKIRTANFWHQNATCRRVRVTKITGSG